MSEKNPDVFRDAKTSSEYYWNSYAHYGIHEEMIKDDVRTNSYRRAIMKNPHLFQGKIVLDVGCGTGILSMFCAQSGASHVYAVDCSDIADQAKQIVKDNGFEDTITVLKGRLEELEIPEKVDIIVSEWMGYFLLYESMLNTVLVARDRYLKEGGIILPDKAKMYVALIEDGDYKDEKINFWDNVYGFDMSCIKKMAYADPLVDNVDGEAVVSSCYLLKTIDIYTVNIEDLTFSADFKLTCKRDDYAHAVVSWFDIDFTGCHQKVSFSTGPFSKQTHWKQTVFYIDEELMLKKGEVIKGNLYCQPNSSNPRDLDIAIELKVKGELSQLDKKYFYQLK